MNYPEQILMTNVQACHIINSKHWQFWPVVCIIFDLKLTWKSHEKNFDITSDADVQHEHPGYNSPNEHQ